MLETSPNDRNEKEDPCNPLNPLKYPELVFGLIGPAGTDLPIVIRSLREELARFEYSVEEIKLSRLIEKFLEKDYSRCTEEDRIDKLMTDGPIFVRQVKWVTPSLYWQLPKSVDSGK